ncbi:hypothetical protein BDN72DRAFT_843559 [Pluteus cervinus]|uniref:Uncharacterized protein n=1 Tax=Pluteus cervinus TaxID=181527 RepID=A0ACD3AQ07_9AGAR|nr:hypothetical protein BDN72DRAFT_843559 [Pluteus cervinus]
MASFEDKHAGARRKIDEEISCLRQRLVTLRRARNTLAPISMLPTELINLIFLFVWGSSTQSYIPIWLSSVCQQWRDIVLHSPVLWSRIRALTTRHIALYIARSGNMPLSFKVRGVPPRPLEVFQAIWDQFPRTKDLIIFIGFQLREEDYSSQHEEGWKAPCPILENLELHSTRLPIGAFSGQAPRLRTLSLFGCRFDWKSLPPFPNLRSLTIRTPDLEISATDFLQTLPTMPNLEYILIDDMLGATDGQTTGGSIIQLPNLRCLDVMNEPCSFLTALFQHLTFPNATKVSITNVHRDTSIVDQANVIDALQNSLDATGEFNSTSIATLHFKTTDTPILDAILSICLRLDLTALEEIEIGGTYNNLMNPLLHFWSAFSSLANLRKLVVRHTMTVILVDHFSHENGQLRTALLYGTTPEAARGLVSFPALQELIYEDGPAPLDIRNYHLLRLEDYLRHRKGIGLVLAKLDVIGRSESLLIDEVKNALRQVVGRFREKVRETSYGDCTVVA